MFTYYFLTEAQFWSALAFTVAMCIAVTVFIPNSGAKFGAVLIGVLTILLAPVMNMDKMSEIWEFEYQGIKENYSELTGMSKDTYGYYIITYMENGWISDEEGRALEDIHYKLSVEPRSDANRDIVKEDMYKKISADLKIKFLSEHN
tara:strand:+ start:4400 stop:4840 length:441 start_codon:yes stop_codon:yes gene_type:complete